MGGTSASVGTGKANTAAINTQCGTGTAAQIAASYNLNGFTDWFLPSVDELSLFIHLLRPLNGLADKFYWSSTEGSAQHGVWTQYTANGAQGNYYQGYTFPVRAIRSF